MIQTAGHRHEAGILYVAFGYEYLLMALNSAGTAKRSNPGLGTALVTNMRVSDIPVIADAFDCIVEEEMQTELNRLAKTQAHRYSPFEKSLFLDCDTEVLGDLTPLFICLDRFDLVLKMDARPTRKIYEIAEGIPGHLFPVWNSGAIFFRKGEAADRFFAEWHRLFQEEGGRSDQPALARTIYVNPDIKLLSVTSLWNTFPQDEELLRAKQVRFKSRIRHYRDADRFADIASRIYDCHASIGGAVTQHNDNAAVIRAVSSVDRRYFRLAKSWYRALHFGPLRGLAQRIAPAMVKSLRRDRERSGTGYKVMGAGSRDDA